MKPAKHGDEHSTTRSKLALGGATAPQAGMVSPMITAGIDAGSRSTKVVVYDWTREKICGRAIADQVVDQASLAEGLLNDCCREAGVDRARIQGIIATGYGRNAVGLATTTITEITCHARGVWHLHPEARTIVEIGGQDSKCIFLEEAGRVRDFAMNDRCAAGSGRFLEVVADRLGVTLQQLADLGRESRAPAIISSMCVVFAETEIIGLLAQGVAPADIAAGVQDAIASRVAAMAGRNLAAEVYFTGGVALQEGMVRSLASNLSHSIKVPKHPQFTGALGAALLARKI